MAGKQVRVSRAIAVPDVREAVLFANSSKRTSLRKSASFFSSISVPTDRERKKAMSKMPLPAWQNCQSKRHLCRGGGA